MLYFFIQYFYSCISYRYFIAVSLPTNNLTFRDFSPSFCSKIKKVYKLNSLQTLLIYFTFLTNLDHNKIIICPGAPNTYINQDLSNISIVDKWIERIVDHINNEMIK